MINTNLEALGRFYSRLASFFTEKKAAVVITTDDSYVGYTMPPDKDGKVKIYLSFTSALYSLEGKPIPEGDRTFYILGVLTHECLHQIFTNFDAVERTSHKFSQMAEKQLFLQVNNILEDSAIEWAAPTKFGGKMLRALYAVIALTYKVSPRIDEMNGMPIPPPLAESFALVQVISALIQVGDRGVYKGEFLSDLAKDAWAEVLPLFNKGVLEPKGEERCKISFEITKVLIPLLNKQEQMARAVQEAMQDAKEHQGVGTGQDIPEDAGSNERNISARKKREDLEKASGENSKASSKADTPDGDSDEPKESEKASSKGNSNDESKENSKASSKGNSNDESKENSKASSKGTPDDESKESEKGSSDSSSDGKETSEGQGDASDASKETSDESSGNEPKDSENGSSDSSSDDKSSDEPEPESSRENNSPPAGSEDTDESLDSDLEISDEDMSEINKGIEDASEQIKEEKKRDEAQMSASRGDYEQNTDTVINQEIRKNIDHSERVYSDVLKEYGLKIKALSRSLKNIFTGDYGGKKNSSRGSKVNVKRAASPVLHPDILISRKDPKDITDMAVYILVDESGSMDCSRYKGKRNIDCAREVVISLYEALHNELNIPVYVTGFSSAGEKARHRHYITWNSPRSKRYDICHLFAGCSNYDFFSIAEATKILKKRGAKHSILVVLSDGQPCYAYYQGEEIQPIPATKKAVEAARKEGISLLGVAMNCPCPEAYNEMYGKDYIKVSTAKDMFGPIATTLRSIVRKWQ